MILTAREVEDLIETGRDGELREVDVVTTGTMGLMSGTYALLSFPMSPPGVYRRFVKGWMNAIPLNIGPCPNEGLGMVDGMVFGTSRSASDPRYGGSHLFRDLVEGNDVDVEVISDRERTVSRTITLEDMPTAKLMSSRNLFRNYSAFINPASVELSSIFNALPFPPDHQGLTFSGCGHLNPLQNDPQFRYIGVGTRLLFNGGEGYVMGTGTRSTPNRPNLMTMADMRGMDPALMGGFQTAEGPECIVTYAVPIPILDDEMLKNVITLDERIPLPVVDVRDRCKVADITYGEVWGHDEVITVDREACIHCSKCKAQQACPTAAIICTEEGPSRDPGRCFNCGICVHVCPQECFRASLGTVQLDIGGFPRSVPIIGRCSNREGALRSMEDLKRRMLDGNFPLGPKVADIRP